MYVCRRLVFDEVRAAVYELSESGLRIGSGAFYFFQKYFKIFN